MSIVQSADGFLIHSEFESGSVNEFHYGIALCTNNGQDEAKPGWVLHALSNSTQIGVNEFIYRGTVISNSYSTACRECCAQDKARGARSREHCSTRT